MHFLPHDDRPGFLNILIIVLSIYVLIMLVIDLFVVLPDEVSLLIWYIDIGVCGVFLLDFFVRFIRAEAKLQFMKWGWIDLLASIPILDYARAGRVIRLFRLLRVFKAYRSLREFINQFYSNRAKGTLASVSVVAILTIILSSIAILQFENVPHGNIHTAEDAIWWAYTTITTVGYGDKYPVTTEGRIVAIVLMTVGVGLFGSFTAYVASWFVKGNTSETEK
jgi:voltage-gated potassium channel